MQTTIKIISEDDFYNTYSPVKNHIDNNASWDGYLYETFGEELDYCYNLSKIENRVWTIIECDNVDDIQLDLENGIEYVTSCLYIVTGFHRINNIGYFITEKPYETDMEIKIDF